MKIRGDLIDKGKKMKKNYLLIVLLLSLFVGHSSAQNNVDGNTIQEKINVNYNNTDDVIRLNYTMNSASPVEIKIIDITGKSIRNLSLPMQFVGNYTEIIDRNNLRDGIYILQMNWAGKRFIKRFIIS